MTSPRLKELSQKIDLVLYLQDNLNEEGAKKIIDDVEKMEGVKAVDFISRQEALDQFLQAHPQKAEIYKKFELENPLPPNLHIQIEDPESYKKIQDSLGEKDYKNLITNLSEEKGDVNITDNIIQNLEKTTRFTRYLMYWLLITFLIGGILMIQNAIHLTIHTRKLEISIMKLVGADRKTIQLPYILEGVWYSVIALIISFLLFMIASKGVLLRELQPFTADSTFPYSMSIFAIEAVMIILLAVGSSMLAVHQHTKEHLLG